MAFKFTWPTFSSSFYEKASHLLTSALSKAPTPPIITDNIVVKEFNLGSVAPDLEMLEIGELGEDKFRGVFKLKYSGDAYIVLQTKVQVSLPLPLCLSLSSKLPSYFICSRYLCYSLLLCEFRTPVFLPVTLCATLCIALSRYSFLCVILLTSGKPAEHPQPPHTLLHLPRHPRSRHSPHSPHVPPPLRLPPLRHHNPRLLKTKGPHPRFPQRPRRLRQSIEHLRLHPSDPTIPATRNRMSPARLDERGGSCYNP